jgi:hypothetical protein
MSLAVALVVLPAACSSSEAPSGAVPSAAPSPGSSTTGSPGAVLSVDGGTTGDGDAPPADAGVDAADGSDGGSEGPRDGSNDGGADDAPTPDDGIPTDGAALFAYLQTGAYRRWAGESAVFPTRAPHGRGTRTYLNGLFLRSLAAGAASHPRGAASVKEIYAADRTTLRGWAVEVKVADASGEGEGWYWYEVLGTAPGTRPVADGVGEEICTGCHAAGDDFFAGTFPLR